MTLLIKLGVDLFKTWCSNLIVVDMLKVGMALVSTVILEWKTLRWAIHTIFFKDEQIKWRHIGGALFFWSILSWVLISLVQMPAEPVASWAMLPADSSQNGTSRLVVKPTITIIAPTITLTPSPSPTSTPGHTFASTVTLTPTCLAENKPGGTEVGRFSSETAEKNTYELISGSEYFEIDGNILRTRQKFNYEFQKKYPITVKVTDESGDNLEKIFHICIENINEPPTLSASPSHISAEVGERVSVDITADDPEGDRVRFTLLGDGKGAVIDPDNGYFTWTPQQPGSYSFTVQATEPDSAEKLSGTVRITVEVVTPPQPCTDKDKSSSPFYISYPVSESSFKLGETIVIILHIKRSAMKSYNYGRYDILYTHYINDKDGDDGRVLSPDQWNQIVSKNSINISDTHTVEKDGNVKIEIPWYSPPSGNYWISARLYYHDGGDYSESQYTQDCAVKVHIRK